MDIPTGFQLDPQSGLYYKEEDSWENGAPIRLVTWLDPKSGATQLVCYPAAEESPVAPEAASSFVCSIPEGFAPYPGSDLYFQTEDCMENGLPVQRVTYYDPADGSYHQVDYPASPPPSEPPEIEEPVAPEPISAEPEEENLPEPAPMAPVENAPDEAPMEAPPLDEEDVLLPPPPEPLFVPTGLPEQNPYAQQPIAPPEPSPIPSDWQQSIEQEPYIGPGMPQPLPEKKSKLAIIAAIAGVLVLAVICICGWQFGWFGGSGAPAGDSGTLKPPAISTPDISPDASSTPEPSDLPDDPSGDVSNPLAQLPISVKVEHYSPWDANITLSGIPFQANYPASVPGKDASVMIYSWGVAFGDYDVSLSYFCQEANDPATITHEDMQCNLWKRKPEGGGSTVSDVSYEITGDSITFYHVTLPPEDMDTFDFSSSAAVYTVRITEGNGWLEQEYPASVSKAASEETPDPLLESVYRYVDEATGMQVVLELRQTEGTYQMEAELGGTTYHIPGVFTVQADGFVTLKSDGTAPIFKNDAQFQLQDNGGLRLETPENIGVLPAGGVLMPAGAAANSSNFPYAGSYLCTDPQLPEDYRPSIHLDERMGFTMILSTDQGLMESAGQFVWDIQTGMLYLNFEHIGGGDPGDGYREAEVKILGDNQLQFLTEGFGLMGYNENRGIFTRQ